MCSFLAPLLIAVVPPSFELFNVPYNDITLSPALILVNAEEVFLPPVKNVVLGMYFICPVQEGDTPLQLLPLPSKSIVTTVFKPVILLSATAAVNLLLKALLFALLLIKATKLAAISTADSLALLSCIAT